MLKPIGTGAKESDYQELKNDIKAVYDELERLKRDLESEIPQLATKLLYVGTGGIRIDPTASIAWGQVANPPYIPQNAYDIGAIPSTYIDASGVWTQQVYAEKIVGNNISGITLSTRGDTTTGANLSVSIEQQYVKCKENGADRVVLGYGTFGISNYPVYGMALMSSLGQGGVFLDTDGIQILAYNKNAYVNHSKILTENTPIVAKFA